MTTWQVQRRSRLRSRSFESVFVFAIGLVVAFLLLVASAIHARAQFGCVRRSLATATATCRGSTGIDSNGDQSGVRVVFAEPPGSSPSER